MKDRYLGPLGDDGFKHDKKIRQGSLRAFRAKHRFGGTLWDIVIWCLDFEDAMQWCEYHGLWFDGAIEQEDVK